MPLNTFLARLVDTIVNPLIVLMFAAAVVYFLWGVFNYIKGAASDSDRKTGAQHILWGVVGMFIMVSVYGIIKVALNTFGLGSSGL